MLLATAFYAALSNSLMCMVSPTPVCVVADFPTLLASLRILRFDLQILGSTVAFY